MAAAMNVMPNMITITAPAISPERMFLRARRRSTGSNLQLRVQDHGCEQQRQVGQRVEVQTQRGAALRPPVEPDRAGHENQSQRYRGGQVDQTEATGAERQLRDG